MNTVAFSDVMLDFSFRKKTSPRFLYINIVSQINLVQQFEVGRQPIIQQMGLGGLEAIVEAAPSYGLCSGLVARVSGCQAPSSQWSVRGTDCARLCRPLVSTMSPRGRPAGRWGMGYNVGTHAHGPGVDLSLSVCSSGTTGEVPLCKVTA